MKEISEILEPVFQEKKQAEMLIVKIYTTSVDDDTVSMCADFLRERGLIDESP